MQESPCSPIVFCDYTNGICANLCVRMEVNMNKNVSKKMTIILTMMVMLVMLVGCKSTETKEDANAITSSEVKTASDIKVALLLPGTVNDKGWSQEAYDGIKKIEELGCQIAYSEGVKTTDFETVFRTYAELGYDIVFGHGTQFGDAALAVAPDYPDTMFCITSSTISQEPNVCSLQNLNNEQGFLAGVVAALATESNKVVAIGGMEIPSIQSFIKGFEQGVAYIDNGTVALTAYTGDFEDATKVKELTKIYMEQGADIITHSANGAGLGVFEAIKGKEGVYAIGSVKDQYEELPEQVLTSAVNGIGDGMKIAVEQYIEGDLKAESYQYGVAEGVIGLAEYHYCEDVLTDEEKQLVEDILEKIKNGEIEIENIQ